MEGGRFRSAVARRHVDAGAFRYRGQPEFSFTPLWQEGPRVADGFDHWAIFMFGRARKEKRGVTTIPRAAVERSARSRTATAGSRHPSYNLGIQCAQDIDYNVAYERQTDFSSINASVAVSHTLVRDSQPFAGGPTTHAFDVGGPRLKLDAKAGNVSGQIEECAYRSL